MGKEVSELLLQNGIVGLFLLILLYFAREVLLNVKNFLFQAIAGYKAEMEHSRNLILDLTTKREDLHTEHADHLKTTQFQLQAVLNENSVANTELAKSLMVVAQGYQMVATALNNQNQTFVSLMEMLRKTNDAQQKPVDI